MDKVPKFVPLTCGHCGMTRLTLNGAWLKERRKKSGLSLRKLAKQAGLSAAFLSDVERGNRHATPRVEAAYQSLFRSPTK